MNAQTKIEVEPRVKLALALAEALPKLEGAKKNAANPHFKSKYADLGAVIEAIRPVAEHGLWFRQVLHEGEHGVTVETLYIGHGAEISAGTLFMPASKSDAQGYGSALTYARRYSLQTAFGLATEDDDGNAAARGTKQESAVSPPPPITDADVAKLMQLVEATSANVPAMLKYLGIGIPNNNLALLDREQHDKVLAALNDKLAKMVKAETNAKAKEPANA